MVRRTRVYWTCQLIGWLAWKLLGLLYTVSYTPDFHFDPRFLVPLAFGGVVEIAWTHGYRAFIRRRQWLALPLGALVPRLVGGILVLAIVSAYSIAPSYILMFDNAVWIGIWILPALASQALAMALWTVIYVGVHYFERWRQAELDKLQLAVAAAEGQLHGLMSQLNPHFLFNCLNSVRALIVEDPAKAQAAVTALSSLMRYSLQAGRVATVPLATELDMVETYLSLEAIRLEERLERTVDVARDELGALHVPTMLVQLLVENGVKHGVERLPDGGAITVTCARDGNALRVTVTNSGTLGESRPGATRVGLANAHERLRLLYGGRAKLALHQVDDRVVAELSLPASRSAPRGAA